MRFSARMLLSHYMQEISPQRPLNQNDTKELGESPERISTIGVFDMMPEQEERFRARVERSQGFVMLFVHPYYHEYVKKTGHILMRKERDEVGKGRIKKIDTTIRKLACLPSEKTAPVIILEMQSEIQSLVEKIGRIRHNKDVNEIYLIENYQHTLIPVLPPGTLHESGSWDILIEKLKQLGVKKILLGGQRLEANQRDFYTGQIFHGKCVGIIHGILDPYFDVTISPFTSPDRV